MIAVRISYDEFTLMVNELVDFDIELGLKKCRRDEIRLMAKELTTIFCIVRPYCYVYIRIRFGCTANGNKDLLFIAASNRRASSWEILYHCFGAPK